MNDEIAQALKKDLGREEFCSFFYEIATITSQIKFDLKHLDSWMKPSKRDTPLALAPAKSRVVYQPLGAVCILGAWNFPFITLLLPLVAVIGAGN